MSISVVKSIYGCIPFYAIMWNVYVPGNQERKEKKKQKTESYNKLYHGIALGGKKTYLLLDA